LRKDKAQSAWLYLEKTSAHSFSLGWLRSILKFSTALSLLGYEEGGTSVGDGLDGAVFGFLDWLTLETPRWEKMLSYQSKRLQKCN